VDPFDQLGRHPHVPAQLLVGLAGQRHWLREQQVEEGEGQMPSGDCRPQVLQGDPRSLDGLGQADPLDGSRIEWLIAMTCQDDAGIDHPADLVRRRAGERGQVGLGEPRHARHGSGMRD
jgi:hypothetical protein